MTPTTTSTCPSCGGALLPGDRFCGNCGTPIGPTGPSGQASFAATVLPTAAGAHVDTSPWGVVATRLQAAVLGEFDIITELGRGGMAAVYLARDLSLNRRVAIKVMAPGLLLGAGMIERFRQEAVTVANLQHAHIVSIHAVRQIDDLHFFVMQFVPGRTLEGVLRDGGRLPIDVVRAWLYQIGSALGYAHRRGVIHRDIKPGNILLNADGEAIVTDFGIAKVAESPSHTQTGTVVGTPVYMSPEQCFAKELTGASDQYSLGIVAYEMLAGKPPFSGSSFALMRAHTDDPPPPLKAARGDVPATMEAALMRMLAKKPEERFATLGEALVSLGASPLSPDDPLHAKLQEYAAASERLQLLGDVIRTPASPVPQTRERPKAGGVGTPAPAPTHALVVVMAHPPTDLEPGASATLRATVKNAAGEAVPGTELHWASGDSSIVAVDAKTGSLKAIAKGRAVVTVIAGTARDSVDVIVGEPKAATIVVTIPPGPVTAGQRISASAVVTSRYGVRVTHPVDWSVDETSIAVIESEAKSTASATTLRTLSAGATGVVASCDGAIGRASLRVVAPPVVEPPPKPVPKVDPPRREPVPAPIAAAPPASAQPVSPPPASPPPKVVPVGGAAKSASWWKWAVPAAGVVAALAYVALKPSAPAVPRGGDSVVVKDSSGSVARDTTTIATRDSARAKDTTSAVKPDSSTTRPDSSISRPPPAAVARRIELQPARPDPISPGQTIALSARVRDAAGAAMTNAGIAWSSGDPRVASVDARGVVKGVGAGATRVSARVGNIVSGVMVTVVPPPPDPTIVASVEVSDVRPMTVGDNTRLNAIARNASGAPVATATIEWTSLNPDIASVASNGTITAKSAGTATIRASAGGRTSDRLVTVKAREIVNRPDTPATNRGGSNTTTPPKSEAELRGEIQEVLATYARAIQTRDTSLIRRVFPNAGNELMTRWQGMFDDARSAIQMTGGTVEILDTPRDVAGARVNARARYTARFSSRRARSDQTFPVAFDAVLQRDAGTWRIASIR